MAVSVVEVVALVIGWCWSSSLSSKPPWFHSQGGFALRASSRDCKSRCGAGLFIALLANASAAPSHCIAIAAASNDLSYKIIAPAAFPKATSTSHFLMVAAPLIMAGSPGWDW
jgi:hypothetical protein